MKTLYTPPRTVLTCIGYDHKEFVDLTKSKFSSVKPIWQENGSNDLHIDAGKAKWVGGSKIIEKDLSDLNQGSNNQLPEVSYADTF